MKKKLILWGGSLTALVAVTTSVIAAMNNLKYKLCCLVLFIPVLVHGQATVYEIPVVDPSHGSVPFVPVLNARTGTVYMTDSEGVLKFTDNDILDSDTLMFQSSFYQQMRVSGGELKSSNPIQLPESVFGMKQIEVYPEKYILKLVKELSSFFSSNYARDYAALMTHWRTVECNGKYREFTGYQGIFTSFDFTQKPVRFEWNDKNRMLTRAPLTVMRSDPLSPTSDEVLENASVHYSDGPVKMWNSNELAVEYVNNTGYTYHELLRSKRSLEMYSPLNPRQTGHFEYRIVGSEEDGEVLVIHFKTRDGIFPNKTQIYGQGLIFYRRGNGLAEKIIMENHQDSHVMFPRLKRLLTVSATQHRIEVEYALTGNKIYTKSITHTVDWVPLPDNFNDKFYRYFWQSRRNPIKNRLKEYNYMEFSDVILVDKALKMTLEQNMGMGGWNYYVGTFLEERWNRLPFPEGIDRQKLERDLFANGKSLYAQARENSSSSAEYYFPNISSSLIERVEDYSRKAREEFFPLLYNKPY